MNIVNYIPYGIKNAVSQEELASVLKCDKRAVRAMVYNARAKGAVICSTCEGTASGYYFPLSVAEAMPYIKMQKNRLNSAETALKPALMFVKQCKKGNKEP